MNLTDAQRVLVDRARRASLLRPEGGDDEHGWSPDSTGDDRNAPDSALELADERRQLRDRLDRLDARERTIVSLRFGLDGDEPMTLKEVGRRLGVTREWVRKIEVRAVRKLDGKAEEQEATPGSPRKRRRVVKSSRVAANPALVAYQPV